MLIAHHHTLIGDLLQFTESPLLNDSCALTCTLTHSLPFLMCFTLQVAGADGTAIIGHNAQMAELALQIGEGDLQQGFQRLLQTLDPCSNRDKSVPVQQVSNANLIRVRVRLGLTV